MTWRENPEVDVSGPEDDTGEPDTVDDEFAKTDAPEQSYDDE